MPAIVLNTNGVQFAPNWSASPRPKEVPVRVLQAGICETDLQLIQGYMGFQGVLGHEFVGIAESGRYQGQRVCGEINCSCGSCDYCLRGLATHCPQRTVLGILNRDGAFADRVWLPEQNLHPIPDNVSNDQAVFVEPLAAAFQISTQLDVHRYQKIVVLGDGRLGNLCSQVLQQQTGRVLAVGKHAWKLHKLSQLGIETALLADLPQERFADLVVDCTGSPSGFETSCQILKPQGTLVLKTTTASPNGPNLAPVVIDEFTVVGSRCGPFAPAIQALSQGNVDVHSLITSRFPLAAGIQALQSAAQKDQLKVLLEISTE